MIHDQFLLSIALVALVEIPAYLGIDTNSTKLDLKSLFSVNAFLMDIIGRKPIILLSMLVAAICCIIPLARDKNDAVFLVGLLTMKSTVAGVFTLIR